MNRLRQEPNISNIIIFGVWKIGSVFVFVDSPSLSWSMQNPPTLGSSMDLIRDCIHLHHIHGRIFFLAVAKSSILKFVQRHGGCGFLNVCCEQPYSANRWMRENPYPEESISVRQVRNHPVEDFFGQVINDPQCGRPDSYSANRRVLDGQPAGFGSFPWQALIRIGKGKCGGVLINRRHIVTAGHCVKNKPLNRILVTLGEYHLKRAEPLPSQNFRVTLSIINRPRHKLYFYDSGASCYLVNWFGGLCRFDVAVLTLNRPANYAPHISPICLPEAGRDPEPGTTAYVAGWGALIPDDITGPLIQILVPEIKRPSVLQVVNVPVLENDRCESWHQNAGIKVNDHSCWRRPLINML
eukprot:TCALIF_06611-PA protein Name:"Similar to Sb Serine proteinase stubble (Drosophila melanogaster)" AED:0.38 eAED:0.41 QI:0/0/0/1/0.5/0.6/5/0/353